MKTIYTILFAVLVAACQPQENGSNPAEEAFKRNAETVGALLESFESGKVDYSVYADDFYYFSTAFGVPRDTIRKAQMMKEDQEMMALYDFEMVTEFDPLPGVNPETKKMDGSVRHYVEWKATKPATDSTEEKTASLLMYETYEFNDEGKIVSQQGYGDFTGIMMYLNGGEDDSTQME